MWAVSIFAATNIPDSNVAWDELSVKLVNGKKTA
jgi:hypothetical protein